MSSCIHCENWGCRRCKPPHEVAASVGGEQGLDANELELIGLRNSLSRTSFECNAYRHLLHTFAYLDPHPTKHPDVANAARDLLCRFPKDGDPS